MKKLTVLFLFFLVSPVSIINCQDREFQNPILAGFYPDPSICRVDTNYYLVNSTFAYFPGIPVFQSTDLVHWKQIGHVLDRPSQLNLNGREVWQGLFAPAINYKAGTFYLINTSVYGIDNFVATAKDPAGPWSDPVKLPEVNGIDPSLFFDDNGKAYIVHNGEAPDNKPLYDGHRAIYILDFDPITLKTIGPRKLLVNGGTDINKKPVWIEGPHIFKKDKYYYLIAAEGGTAYDHSEVVFRSENVYGPYESYSGNPILTQRNLDKTRPFPITSTGHADFVHTQNNEWWAVFLGCRPYQGGLYNTGRETFMAPVTWTSDGWPVIVPGSEAVKYSYPIPNLPENNISDFPRNGNFEMTDNFDAGVLAPYWVFLRTPFKKWYSLQNGKLKIQPQTETISGNQNPSAVLRRQQHAVCTIETSFDFTPDSIGDLAGLIVFMNEKHFYIVGKTVLNGKPTAAIYKSKDGEPSGMELIGSKVLDIQAMNYNLVLKIEINSGSCNFLFSQKPETWEMLLSNADATILSTEIAGGFTGTMLGAYVTSLRKNASNEAQFDWVRYVGKDEVYNQDEIQTDK